MIKIGFLGGADDIGKSMVYIEYGKSAIVVDCGMQFPSELELFGVNRIVPFGSYIKQNLHKIKGVFITHLHEDHIGGLRRFLEKYKIPIYAEALTCEYMKSKNNYRDNATFYPLRENEVIKIGSFSIRPFLVEHSTIKAFGYEIKTNYGNIVLTGDFKLGNSMIDAAENVEKWGIKESPLVLISESTGADQDGFSKHEADIIDNINALIKENKGKIMIVSTFASNMERVKNIIIAAQKLNKNILVAGRNMEFAVKFLINQKIIPKSKVKFVSDDDCNIGDDVLILSTGCQGEPNGGLYKLIKLLKNKKNKHVLLSSSVIPGNEKSVNRLKCELLKNGFSYIYDSELYHASGHAKKEEIKCLISALNPKIFIPVHGDYIKQISNKDNALACGVSEDNIIIPENSSLAKIMKDSFELEKISDFVEYITSNGIVRDDFVDEKKLIARNGAFVFVVDGNYIKFSSIGIPENCKLTRVGRIFAKNYQDERISNDFDKDVFCKKCEAFLHAELKNSSNMPSIQVIVLDNFKNQNKNKKYR